MATIRGMITEKLQRSGRCTDAEMIKGRVRQHLEEVCTALPNESPIGRDFSKVMFEIPDHQVREDAILTLVEKVMDERDDLSDYPYLRRALLCEIMR